MSSKKNIDSGVRVNRFDVWCLGLTIVIGGQYFCWNAGLTAGFGSYFIALVLTSAAYICLCFCSSELTSALPFAWGACGLARCTLGYYPGFAVGCFESVEYIAYVASTVVSLGGMISKLIPGAEAYQPLVWALFYISALLILIFGGRWFWRVNAVLALVSLGILLMFCFGSMPYLDFAENATLDGAWFVGGGAGFMGALRLTAWFFVGVESLVLATNDVENPRITIAGGQVACVLTLFVTAILVLFVTCSLSPGIGTLPEDLNPFNRGFTRMFHLTEAQAIVFTLPATYATAFGFIYSYGKLMSAMAESRLYPSFLANKYKGAPYASMLVGSVIGYLLCALQYAVPSVASHMYDICILGAYFSYIAQCVGYIFMRTKFSNIKRDWRSPLGIGGAVFAIFVWLLSALSVMGFANDGQFALIAFVVVMAVGSAYYFLYANSRQQFSADEKKILFIAHIINFNGTKAAKNKQKAKKYPWIQRVSRFLSSRSVSVSDARTGSKAAATDSRSPANRQKAKGGHHNPVGNDGESAGVGEGHDVVSSSESKSFCVGENDLSVATRGKPVDAIIDQLYELGRKEGQEGGGADDYGSHLSSKFVEMMDAPFMVSAASVKQSGSLARGLSRNSVLPLAVDPVVLRHHPDESMSGRSGRRADLAALDDGSKETFNKHCDNKVRHVDDEANDKCVEDALESNAPAAAAASTILFEKYSSFSAQVAARDVKPPLSNDYQLMEVSDLEM